MHNIKDTHDLTVSSPVLSDDFTLLKECNNTIASTQSANMQKDPNPATQTNTYDNIQKSAVKQARKETVKHEQVRSMVNPKIRTKNQSTLKECYL